jgi:hypothetical protein
VDRAAYRKVRCGQALVGLYAVDELLTEWRVFGNRLHFAIKRTNRSGEDTSIQAAIQLQQAQYPHHCA